MTAPAGRPRVGSSAPYTSSMATRLGLRSRILASTMPVVLVVSAAIAALLYTALDDVLERSAKDLATAEAREVAAEVGRDGVDGLLTTNVVFARSEIVQVVNPQTGAVVETTDASVVAPLADPVVPFGGERVDLVPEISRASTTAPYVVAVVDASDRDGRRYSVLVGVAARMEDSYIGRTTELLGLALVGLVALAAAVTTFAVGQALRPVERLRDQLELLAASGPAPALEVPGGRDELARLAETMNRVLARLQQSDSSRRAFVADAGHELRSPLTTLGVLLERLAGDHGPAQRRDLATRAVAEVDRLSALVEDLLVLASADESQLAIRRDDVDLDDVVVQEVGALRTRGLPVAMTVEPARVIGDVAQLGRAVRNLLENAERHLRSAARVQVAHRGGQVILLVDNDGPPVPLAERDRVFGRFVRLDDSRARHTGGSGLGLAIVAEIVTAHGGSVATGESPGGWCRFEIRLPRAPELR
jgi:signal transduction histidine kinase